MCMIDDSERCDVWNATHPKAAKEHICTECRRTIARGETYLHIKSLFDGRWTIERVCSHCSVGASWLSAECGGYCQGGILEDIREHADEYRSFGLWRLIVGARRKWRRHDGALMPIPKMPRLSDPA